MNTIFDKVVEDQRMPLMSKCLDRVVVRGNRLAALADRAWALGSTEWSYSMH